MWPSRQTGGLNNHHRWRLGSGKIRSVEELETLPARTKPGAPSHDRSPGGQKGEALADLPSKDEKGHRQSAKRFKGDAVDTSESGGGVHMFLFCFSFLPPVHIYEDRTEQNTILWGSAPLLHILKTSLWFRSTLVKNQSGEGAEQKHSLSKMDVWPLHTRLCAHPEISPESNSVQTPQKSFGSDYKPMSSVCIRMQKDPVVYVRVRWTMETTLKMTVMASFAADGH